MISNNWCYNVAARCYQIRGGSNNVWHNNTADDANWGVLAGDLSPTNNKFYNNIIGPDVKAYGSGYSAGGMMVVENPSHGSGNQFWSDCMASQVTAGSSAAVSIFGKPLPLSRSQTPPITTTTSVPQPPTTPAEVTRLRTGTRDRPAARRRPRPARALAVLG